jgi:hypothetical protein
VLLMAHVLSSTTDTPAQIKHDRKVPVPMLHSEVVRIETAMHFALVSDKTIRKWAKVDGIGRQAERHAPLQISFPALLMKLDGNASALELLREGHRQHPEVSLYLTRGIELLEEERRRR